MIVDDEGEEEAYVVVDDFRFVPCDVNGHDVNLCADGRPLGNGFGFDKAVKREQVRYLQCSSSNEWRL